MIEAKQVRYGIRSREILRGVDFRVEKGEFVGLIGPNGSGKSTFLKNVYKVLRPQAGELTLMGDDLLAMSNREMAQRLAVMVQEQEAAFDFTVEEVVMMGRQARKRLLETDSPYLSPVPWRGKRNEPAFTVFTVRHMAAARGMEPEELWQLCGDNARRFFGV